jgi:hypothetical protein
MREHADAIKLLNRCTAAIQAAAKATKSAEAKGDLATVADLIADVRELSIQITNTAAVIAHAVAVDGARNE